MQTGLRSCFKNPAGSRAWSTPGIFKTASYTRASTGLAFSNCVFLLIGLAVLVGAASARSETSLVQAGADKIRLEYRAGQAAVGRVLNDFCLVGIPPTGAVRLEVVEVEAEGRPTGVPVRLGEPGWIRDQRVVGLSFGPWPGGGGYRRVAVDVHLDPAAAAYRAAPRPDRWTESLLRRQLVNYQQARSWRMYSSRAAKRALQFDDPVLLRMIVDKLGIHRVTGADLAAAGVDLKRVDPQNIRLFYSGGGRLVRRFEEEPIVIERRERPIVVEDGGDGRFNRGDAVLFYAEPASRFVLDNSLGRFNYLHNVYTDENVYWLGLGGQRPGERAGRQIRAPNRPDLPVVRSYRERIRREEEAFVLTQAAGNINSGFDWYWQDFRGNSRNFSIVVADPIDEPVDVRLGFFGWSSGEHWFAVRWNDDVVGRIKYAGSEANIVEVQTERGPQEGLNLLGLDHQDVETTRLDWFELEYGRRLIARGGELLFDSPVHDLWAQFELGGFEQAPRLFRVDQWSLVELTGGQHDPATGQVVFQDSAGVALQRYVAVGEAGWKRPARLELDTPSQLRGAGNGADYLIITHADFAAAAQRLARWRGQDDRFGRPLVSRVVDVQDIYDEFAGGLVDPAAIRNFVQWAFQEWDPAPFFVLLLGDGTYDYKNNSGLSLGNWIPAYQDGDSTYDEWFVRVAGDDRLPDLAIGRISVQTAAEAGVVVDKLIDYDRAPEVGPWQSRGLIVADDIRNPSHGADDPPEADFLLDAERLSRQLESGERNLVKHYIGLFPLQGQTKPGARDEFLRLFNAGALFVTYVGHGNRDVLAHEQIFVLSRDMDQIANGRRLPLLYTAASQVGVFDDPVRTSMPEVLLKQPDGGVIGMIAATRIGFHATNMDLAFKFHEIMFDPNRPFMPVGQALLEAKQRVGVPQEGPYGRRNVQRYSLFGDPALRLAQPPLRVQLSVADTLPALGEVRVQGQVVDRAGQPVALEGSAWVQAFDSAIAARIEGLAYQQLGSPLFRGRLPVRKGRLETTFRVPKDINYQGAQGRISAFVSGADQRTAFGAAQNLVLSGTAADLPADVEGPAITLGFARGQVRADGVRVGRRPLLQAVLRDASGINITGATGHQIQLTVDGQVFTLTDRFATGADYREGGLDFELPALAAGLHQVRLKAWDTFNNSGTAQVQVQVDEAVEDLLGRALFHPNPLRGAAGAFTFELAEAARRVQVGVYGLSGRQVAGWETSGVRGFNQVPWAPGALANGAYVYRLRALGPDGRWAEVTRILQIVR